MSGYLVVCNTNTQNMNFYNST